MKVNRGAGGNPPHFRAHNVEMIEIFPDVCAD